MNNVDSNLNGYYAYLNRGSRKGVVLGKFVEGKLTLLDSYITPIDLQTPYKLELKAEGDLLFVYLDDKLVIKKTDGDYLKGSYGFRGIGAPAIYQNLIIKVD